MHELRRAERTYTPKQIKDIYSSSGHASKAGQLLHIIEQKTEQELGVDKKLDVLGYALDTVFFMAILLSFLSAIVLAGSLFG